MQSNGCTFLISLSTNLFQDCVPYLPMVNGRHQKTVKHGDQGFFERGRTNVNGKKYLNLK